MADPACFGLPRDHPRLHADKLFRADLAAAKAEYNAIRTNGLKPSRDCDAEVQALAVRMQSLDGEVEILESWHGDHPVDRLDRLPEKQREHPVGFIDFVKTFAGVWKAFKPGEAVPEIDLKVNLVLFARNTQFYNSIRIGKVNVKNGVAEVLAMETVSAIPIEDKVAMSVAVVHRQGITAIQIGDENIPIEAVREKQGDAVMSRTAFIWLCLVLLLGGVSSAFSQDAPPTAPSKETKTVEKPVMLGDKILFHLATEAEGFTQANRAEESSRRIKKMADSTTFAVDAIKTHDYTGPMTFILAGDEVLTAVLDRDAALRGKPRQQLADEYVQILRTAIEKYRKERSIEQHMYSGLYTFIATIMLIVILMLIGKLKIKIDLRIEERFTGWKKGVQIQSFEIVRADKISELLKGCVRGIRLILVLLLLYIYLQLVLGFFPLTRSIAGQVFVYVLSPLTTIGKGLIVQIPNLIFIAVLVLIVRYVLKVMKIFFLGVERERIKLSGFYPEWARSTYRLLSYLVIAFTAIIAFPYIPGSNSMAFKGVSVFIGVLVSIGSQSAISNIIAGFAITYRRVFRVGDRVRIADSTGDVIETTLQVTILRTMKNEEIIVPNSLIMNSQVTNYSVEARDRGLILHTTVSLGYDTPWRQVQAMLLMAARKTTGLLDKPEPFVLKKSLDDFYVTYELNVYTDKPEKMAGFYSELHQNILDVFNEYGVQIMSPNYESDRAELAIVPKERWYTPPAKAPE